MADLSAEELERLKSLAGRGLADVLVREVVSVDVPRLVAEVERRRAPASPGAETVEQRVRDLEKMLKRVTSWLKEMIKDRATLGHPLSDSGSLAMAVRDACALLTASSGKTGEPACGCDEHHLCERCRVEGHCCGEDGSYCDSDAHSAATCACGSVMWVVYEGGTWQRMVCARCAMERPAPVSQGPERPRVVARPDLETCAHGLRRSDCEWCVYSGTQPAPGPEREEPPAVGVDGGPNRDSMICYAGTHINCRHDPRTAPSPASTPEPAPAAPETERKETDDA